MNRAWPATLKVLTGALLTAVSAMPQAYTVSAKPGVVNYIEGDVSINGKALSSAMPKATFLNREDTLSTGRGKAEVLLAPGIFLRVGNDSQVRMISPSLTDTQLEVKSGEAMVEADNIVKDSQLTVKVGSGSALIDRNGLYRFTAGDSPVAAVLEGKATVFDGERKLEIGKGKEVLLAQAKTEKFDAKKQDELYAWSNVRAQYDAASSYQAARDVNASSYGGVWGGYGYSGFANPGWMWNSAFGSWAWVPGDAYFYSPFGFGFYSPGLVGYAPVIYAPVYGGGYYTGNGTASGGGGGTTVTKPVPVNPVRPPVVGGVVAASPAMHEAARTAAVRSYASAGGFRTATGATVPAGHAAVSSGGSSGGHSSGYYSGGSSSVSGISSVSSVSAPSHGGGGGSAGGGHH
ncbi:MAG TPA: FecR domain-containing protein [Bryobacteraceae bacterium]|jgi:hypothetical protein|nr:FecR domain-containing protein [Bryobacteraceae bacterium]